MERFRNGEIDVDNLCSQLRIKARGSEGGVVVNQTDVDDIMGRAKSGWRRRTAHLLVSLMKSLRRLGGLLGRLSVLWVYNVVEFYV
ncbi:bZIP transcription factor bZIP-1 [Penicillium cf. griseofulvum]|nr:bZIP transcription factor bZIP-1 [Penicillium cf. griseofulvum]KAJ5433946.1 bZIP transcription factor bZIP-1 [Penicillium cf. griseofulvum]